MELDALAQLHFQDLRRNPLPFGGEARFGAEVRIGQIERDQLLVDVVLIFAGCRTRIVGRVERPGAAHALQRDIDGRTVFGTRDLVEAEDCSGKKG